MNAKRVLIGICILGLCIAGCGPNTQQQVEQVLSGVAETTVAGVTLVPETPVATLDVNLVVKQTFEAMTQQAGGAPAAATPAAPGVQPTAASNATTGSISGDLNYPGPTIPAMYVAAFLYGTESYQYIITVPGQNTYTILGLEPGTYWVIAYTVGGGGFTAGFPGGYTKAVPCGLGPTCTDHSMIGVVVKAATVSKGVNPIDWYAPSRTFQPFPQLGPGAAGATPVSNPPSSGTISGTLTYPASSLPAMRIAAFDPTTHQVSYVDTQAGQASYSLNVPAGNYTVVAYSLGGGGFSSTAEGGYTQAVPCGLSVSCTDHTLILVNVSAGQTTAGVNPGDWYAPSGAFPPKPGP